MVRFSTPGSFLVLTLSTTASQGQECTLDCPIDAPCRIGSADFSSHTFAEELPKQFDGMHCACPPGWTGVLCDHKYESCTSNHNCYHGGKCVSGLLDLYGNDQLFCDCSNAVETDGTKYVGKYCETPFDKICNDDGSLFCVNGGDCNFNYPDKDAEPCLCEPGWEGFHCEFKTGQVPECTLGCQNDGVCVVGVLSAKEASQHHSIWGSSQEINDHMRCLCPPGFGGPTCESVSQCDLEDSHQCLHGGTCVTTQVTSQETGLVETEYHCDCTTAANGQDRHTGQFCQFQSETYCSDVDVNLWCTNGGKCDEEDPTNGCICPEGFAGFKCEYPQTAKEDKPSNNDDDDHLDFELCGGNVCHNGGSCTTTVVTTSNGGKLEQEHCDCSTAIRETDMANATVYAGDSCQFEASVFCTLPQDGMPLSSSMFCVNGGLCRDHVLQGCDCPTGWTGFHCEYPEETIELTDSTDDDLEDAVECGGRYCYNGGVCEEFQEINDNGEYATIRECDCASATTDTELFAGDQCQYRSTELCTEPEDGEAHKGQRFCVNHGACREDPLDDCDCPAGWKGSMCQFPVEDDSYADQGEECGDRYCYNGGSCVTTKVTRKSETTTEYYCDCANAFDDSNLYAGDSCEYKSTSLCTLSKLGDSLEGILFCTNHGECQEEVQKGCACSPEWTGFHCEFATNAEDIAEDLDEDDNDVEGTVEGCGDLVCLNGGKCTMSIIESEGKRTEVNSCDCSGSFTSSDLYAGPQCEYKSTQFCSGPVEGADSLAGVQFCVNGGTCNEHLLQGCSCPPAWTGFRCQFPVDVEDLASKDTVLVDDYVECGDDYCYYGGTCNEYEVNGETEYSCDCSTAFSETDLYAGRSCQYRSTSFCSSLPDTDSLAGTEFCTNYGQCLDGGGCGCPAGYEGLRCEFAQYPDQDFEDNLAPNDGKQSSEDDDGYQCRLQCYNGGICAKGAKDLGSLQKTVEHVDHLNKTYDKVFFEHCVCQDGWVGLQCEHVADICGDSEHVCLHGSTCVKNNQHHSCDCSQADERIVGADQPLFAGDSCQHPATDICIQGEDYQGRPMYFCVNNGVCKDYVTGEEDPPGCDCPAGWIGPHCEIRTRSDISRTKQGVQIFLLVLILTLVTAALIASCKYFIRNQSSSHDSQDCMPFRRRRRVRALNSLDEQRSNLAPARTPSDAAPRTPTFSSSSDPIAAGMELPPDDEPKDEPYDQYQYEPEAEPDLCRDEPVLFNIGPPRDEDGNQLHNVDFV